MVGLQMIYASTYCLEIVLSYGTKTILCAKKEYSPMKSFWWYGNLQTNTLKSSSMNRLSKRENETTMDIAVCDNEVSPRQARATRLQTAEGSVELGSWKDIIPAQNRESQISSECDDAGWRWELETGIIAGVIGKGVLKQYIKRQLGDSQKWELILHRWGQKAQVSPHFGDV